MEKLFIAGSLSMAVFLGACGSDSEESTPSKSEIEFYVDQSTNCQYIIYDGYNNGAMVPRMNADGTQMCSK